MTSTASFYKKNKKNTELYVFIYHGTKITYPGHQKPTILLIFGHPMTTKLNLKDKGQMSKPNEYTDNFKSNTMAS